MKPVQALRATLAVTAVVAAGVHAIRGMTLIVDEQWEFALMAFALAAFLVDAGRRM